MKNLNLHYFAKNLSIVVALVLIWRGIWYVLDAIDYLVFSARSLADCNPFTIEGGIHIYSAIAGIILGVIMLYLPDKDLKEISKL